MKNDDLIAAAVAMVEYDTRTVIDLIEITGMVDLSSFYLLHSRSLRELPKEARAIRLAFLYKNARRLVLE